MKLRLSLKWEQEKDEGPKDIVRWRDQQRLIDRQMDRQEDTGVHRGSVGVVALRVWSRGNRKCLQQTEKEKAAGRDFLAVRRPEPAPTPGDPGNFLLSLTLGFPIHKMRFGPDCL